MDRPINKRRRRSNFVGEPSHRILRQRATQRRRRPEKIPRIWSAAQANSCIDWPPIRNAKAELRPANITAAAAKGETVKGEAGPRKRGAAGGGVAGPWSVVQREQRPHKLRSPAG